MGSGKKVLCSVGLKLSREHNISFSLSVTLAHVHGSFSSCSVLPPKILGFLTRTNHKLNPDCCL